MELIKYFDIIRKWFWLIVLATVLAAGSGLISSLLAVPVYRTSTTLIVGQVIQDPNPNTGDFYAGEQLARTYVQLVTREPILSATIKTLGLQTDWRALKGQVNAASIANTQLLEIAVLDTSPERAQAIANELGRQLILQSPTTTATEDTERLDFVRSQLPELESKIKDGQARVAQLDGVIANATSARQILDAQQRQAVIQSQISDWQSTHAQLLLSLQKGSLNYISIVDPAEKPFSPVSPNIVLNTLLAVLLGLTLSVAAAFLLEYLDDTIRSPEEVRALIGAPTLAVISKFTGGDYSEMLITEREPRSPITETYRSLRTNLQFLAIDSPLRVILITSSGPGEGKSVTASNLAAVFARAGKSVILVDADLRRPVVHKIFGLKNRIGLTTWLVGQGEEGGAQGGPNGADATEVGRHSLLSYLQPTPVPKLQVLCSGALPPNPAEVLGSNRMREFLDEATAMADVVIVDSPPCVTVTDAVVLSQWVNGVLLVLDSQNTHRQGAKRAKENLAAAGARVLGAVVNRFDTRGSGYYYYGYSSYYYYSSEEHTNSKSNGNGRVKTTGLLGRLSRYFEPTPKKGSKEPASKS
jgi:non-specific protein-tyrosine kinase